MPTKRTPIVRRPLRKPFTPEVLEAFKKLVQIFDEGDCSCQPIDWKGEYWRHERCASCQAYDKAEAEFVVLLNLSPHEMLDNPHTESPYPPGSKQYDMQRHASVYRKGRALWRRLEAASGVSPRAVSTEDVGS